MEGSERQHVEARVRVLRNIQTLLDAAVVQMNQYASVVASLDMTTSDTSTSRNCPPTTEQMQATQSEAQAAAATTQLPTPATTTTTEPTPSTSEDKGAAGLAESTAGSTGAIEKSHAASPPVQRAEEDEQQEEIRRRRLERFS